MSIQGKEKMEMFEERTCILSTGKEEKLCSRNIPSLNDKKLCLW